MPQYEAIYLLRMFPKAKLIKTFDYRPGVSLHTLSLLPYFDLGRACNGSCTYLLNWRARTPKSGGRVRNKLEIRRELVA